MVMMAALAPEGIFEEEDFIPFFPEADEPYERRFDDYTRNLEDVA